MKNIFDESLDLACEFAELTVDEEQAAEGGCGRCGGYCGWQTPVAGQSCSQSIGCCR
jgi:hypothetical protein